MLLLLCEVELYCRLASPTRTTNSLTHTHTHSHPGTTPQGIEDQFLEQWHQKLHTNTTPEDVHICEAYLAFLSSGNMDDFW